MEQGSIFTLIQKEISQSLQLLPTDPMIFIVDMLLKGAVKRVVIPYAKVTAIAEVVYKKGQAVGYQPTLSAYPADTEGNSHFEYIKATTAAASSSEETTGEPAGEG